MDLANTGVDRIHETDVLIVGGGGAAMRAAVAAFDAGARVTVVLKGRRGRSGATVSQDSGSVAWQLADDCSGPEDSPEVHARNIIDVGLGMADPALARLLADELIDRSAELERWGLRFIPDPSGEKPHYSGYSCFGDQPRAHGILNSGFGHAGDVVRVLVDQIRRRQIEVHEEIFVVDLVVEGGQCRGAVTLGPGGEVIAYAAGAVVLAAGGARQIYPPEPSRSTIDTTGDGYAVALRAGAELSNMEFTQYMLHPIRPFPVEVPGVFWALLPKLLNRLGEDALAPYLPAGVDRAAVMAERTLHYPFSSRDISRYLDIAFASELRAGRGTPEGGLFLDFSEVDPARAVLSRPQHIPQDPAKPIVLPPGLAQVRPAAHAINGGIWIDRRAESTLPGLFAAGEAATGQHGADRLGGGMVSGSMVFGERAGRFAGERALGLGTRELSKASLAEATSRLGSFGLGTRPADQILAALQEAAGRHLIVLRHAQGLQTLLARIRELTTEWLPQVAVGDASALRRAIEAHNSLITAELMARAGLMRRESRGGHFREDYPQQDDANWLARIAFLQSRGQVQEYLRPSVQASSG